MSDASSHDATTTAPSALTTRQRNRAQLLERIRLVTPHEDRAIGMHPRLFVQAMLPHREVVERGSDGQPLTVPTGRLGSDDQPEVEKVRASYYSATSGAFTLTIRAGLRRDRLSRALGVDAALVSRGIPYGGLARLLLTHLITEAVKRRNRDVELGATLAAFCARLGITPSGGKHGRLRYVVDQLERLATAAVTFEYEETMRGQRGGLARSDLRGEQLLVVDRYHFWHHSASDTGVPSGVLRLGGRLWEEVQAGCFPVDLRKLQFLRAHPLAMDLYVWLTYRQRALQRSGRSEVALSYDDLHGQLGSHYQTDERGVLTPRGKKDFGVGVRKALDAVQLTWPALDVLTPRGRIILRSTGPDIRPRPCL